MYTKKHDGPIGTMYLVIGIGSMIFFLFGVFALCCCCRKQFRGIERKGFVIGETAPTQSLMPPPAPGYNPAVISGVSRGQIPQISPVSAPPQVPQFSPVGGPPDAPPPYDLPPKQ